MKRFFIIALSVALALCGGMYLYSHMQIQNVFDEMYYGYHNIGSFWLTCTSYDNFGLQDIPNSLRNMVDNEMIEYLETDLLNAGELLSFEWIPHEKQLKFMYICPSVNADFNYVFDIIYSPKSSTLRYLPLRIASNSDLSYNDMDSFLKSHGMTRASIEELLSENFFNQIVMRWVEVNGRKSRFTLDSIGNISIENQLWGE